MAWPTQRKRSFDMSKSRLEGKVGLFVFVGLVLMGILVLQFSKGMSLFRSTYDILLDTGNVGGLKTRAGVLMSGVQVGSVEAIDLASDGKTVRITLRIYKSYEIHKDAIFTIEQSGFLGDQYIAVEPTTNALPVFKHLETARAADPFNLQEAARKATGFIERLDTMAEKLDASLVDLRRNLLNEYTLTNLAATAANLRLASANAVQAVSNINLFVASNAPAYAVSGSNLMQFSEQLKELAASLSVLVETNSPGIHQSVQNVEGATASLKSMMEDAQAGKGLVGKLLVDETMARDVGDISRNLSHDEQQLESPGLVGHPLGQKTSPNQCADDKDIDFTQGFSRLRAMALWVIRILFLSLCTVGGFAISQVRPEFVGGHYSSIIGMAIGFGFGWVMIAIDEMLKGFSLRAFSATTFGLLLGTVVALLIDRSGLFDNVEQVPTRWLIRLGLFLSFSYIGIVLAMRSNKEDFSLIIPYVRFSPPEQAGQPLAPGHERRHRWPCRRPH